jgi:hypothetical protein
MRTKPENPARGDDFFLNFWFLPHSDGGDVWTGKGKTFLGYHNALIRLVFVV